jgi:hypothetical protein
MSSLPIVEELEVLEQVSARRGARGPRSVVNELDLERREEALGDGVVPAIATAAHAADDPVLRQDLLVVAASVLPKFNRSSQHRTERGCDDDTKKAFGMGRTRETTLARPALGSAA